ncbi:sodium:proton antiporter [Alcaligenaceae bacterium CGII-47]|nr:sodium:proton antiporter [Alcaligenaceae bacterium CGII-47]
MNDHSVMLLAGIGMIAMLCQWVAWRLHLPAILFLLLAGLAVGPGIGWLDPDALFGDLLFPFISLSVAVILFEGSLSLRFHEIRGLEGVVRRMTGVGILITWAVTTIAAHWIIGWSWELALLFGAIMVVTGPTVIGPLLRTVRPVARVARILRWEGIVVDPIGALLAVLSYEFIVASQARAGLGHTLLIFGETVLTGMGAGLVAGFALGEILRRNWLADYLVNVTVLITVFAVFALSNTFLSESGLLAVTIMGIWLGNRKGVPIEDIMAFKETLSLLLLSGLFIILAARMDFADLLVLGWQGPAVLAVLLLIARPLKVAFSTWGSGLPWQERVLLTWIAPRGIVAAAVSALFAIKLQHLGMAQANQLMPLTFIVIVGTVVLQSITARPVALALNVAEPDPVGFLVVGVGPIAQAIALALQAAKVPVRLCGSDWDGVTKARMAGLPVYYGSPLSEDAQRNLDLAGMGRLLAIGPSDDFNTLVTSWFVDHYGRGNAYALPDGRRVDGTDKHQASALHRPVTLFAEEASYWVLMRILAEGGAVRSTTLTEAYGYTQYETSYAGRFTPLFALTPKGYARPFTPGQDWRPEAGWTVLSLFSAEVEQERVQARRIASQGGDLDAEATREAAA